MKIVFRADASLQIGSGHVMRCLTLANALHKRGDECHFICREHPGNLIAQIESAGHDVHRLAARSAVHELADVQDKGALAHAAWLGATQVEDAMYCATVLIELKPDWLVVDHYALDVHWEQPLRHLCGNVLAIDDLADRVHDCDLLLDQTFARNAEDYLPWVTPTCRVLVGSRYALLRPEFSALRASSLKRREAIAPVRKILISMGGVDQMNITGDALAVLAELRLPHELQVKVVMGGKAPWLEAVRLQVAQLNFNVQVLVDQSDMASLMAEADLAIGAAGSTAWERCCLGLPSILIVLADNQRSVAAGLESYGAAWVVKDARQTRQILPPMLEQFFLTPELCHAMTVAAAQVTDGAGVQAVIDAMESLCDNR